MAVFVDFDSEKMVASVVRQKQHPGTGFFEIVPVAPQEVVEGLAVDPNTGEPVAIKGVKLLPDIDPVTQVGVEGSAIQAAPAELCLDADTGFLVERPKVPDPIYDELAKTLSLGPFSAGTEVEVFDLSGHEQIAEFTVDIEGWADQLTFSDPGTYRIEIRPPVPYLPIILELSIAN